MIIRSNCNMLKYLVTYDSSIYLSIEALTPVRAPALVKVCTKVNVSVRAGLLRVKRLTNHKLPNSRSIQTASLIGGNFGHGTQRKSCSRSRSNNQTHVCGLNHTGSFRSVQIKKILD